ncbi:PREDICTED: proton pump-interactor 1-like [Tarenaya hassleriana]|uniref:proton pump-interactor 1-like n=1 Tax=Tarenaya hassleriana TaxID=28532 RepID=UPI00053C9622|nr:PREDICTED: proton pump-interactor 1-like [Tarenaya hassleriana]
MGVEVGKSDGFEVASSPFEGKAEQNGKLVHGKGEKVSIKFGSHDEPSKGEENNNVFGSDTPKDIIEEWPAAKQVHSFFFVRYRPFEDPKIKAKLDQADKELQKLNRARAGVVEELKAKRAERSELFDILEPLKNERKGFNTIFDEKRKEMEPLQQALGKLRSNDGGGRGIALCSSEEELNDTIYSLQYHIQHESISLNEEKQILKEIKQLEGTREKVIANAAMRAKIKEAMGKKEDIQDQVKSMGADLDGVKKERQAISGKINQLSEKVKAIKDEIQLLENELKVVTDKRDKAFANIQDLRKQRDESNSKFYQSRAVLNKARELAAQKNIKDLEALSHAEVDSFMSLWCSKKNFRDDYEKRILPSLDARQLSRDGRMRNPEEKPLVTPEAPPSKAMPSDTEVPPKAKAKQHKEDSGSAPKAEVRVSQKTQKETGEKAKDTGKVKNTADDDDDEDEVYGLGKQQKEEKKAVDEATLKEMRRQEEIAKAKQAMERKKKLAEKAASKAAIRAQKEAEKKEKERERRAKKKAPEAEAAAEEVAEDSGPEKNEVEAASVQEEKKPEKEKAPKEKPIRNRIRTRGPETLPRAIRKQKKSTNYWVYAAPAAVLFVILLLALGYYYAF